MKRTAVLLFLVTLFVAPSAFACYYCDGWTDSYGIDQQMCAGGDGWDGAYATCYDTQQRTDCPDPNQVGPCYQFACHPRLICRIAINGKALDFGRPLVAGQVIAEVRRHSGPVMAVAR